MLKLLVQAVIAAAATAIASYFLFIREPLESLEQAGEAHVRLQREYRALYAYRVNLDAFRAQIPAMKDLGKAAQTILPDFDGLGAGRQDLEDWVRAAAKEKQLKPPIEFSAADWSSKEFYYYRPFTVRVSGEFTRVTEFLQLVSTGSPQLRVLKSASVRPVEGRDEVTLSLEALAIRHRDYEPAVAEPIKNRRRGRAQ
ncbi:MAG TPA: type 4a pilus biogenesis protein PilO [Burkholderiales bacterium]|jgi:Tfp pilus assembly protein PilO|nr:type 4a pilus biogenesis protein PilO [Burkholderiales bacterium]